MKTLTFQEQYNKIVGAYYKNELNPHESCACFVGNLLNNQDMWGFARTASNFDFQAPEVEVVPTSDRWWGKYLGIKCIKQESNGLYTLEDIIQLEQNFLRKYNEGKNEDSLFEAMVTTLELLRKIHEEKGEVMQDYNFERRTLLV